MSALTLTLPDGGALALRAGQLTQCAWSPANQTAISAALLAAGQVTLALPAQGGLLSTLSVADNLTLAASYHGMPGFRSLPEAAYRRMGVLGSNQPCSHSRAASSAARPSTASAINHHSRRARAGRGSVVMVGVPSIQRPVAQGGPGG